jgi:tripartite-type tricarboxylate transporter receptor subunit TctC
LGLKGLDRLVWHGFVAPKGTPAAFVEHFSTALRTVAEGAAFRQAQESLGRVIAPTSPTQMREMVATEIPEWADIVKRAGITLQ